MSPARRPKHVCQAAPNMTIAILCLFCDTVNRNHDLGRDFFYGFNLGGLMPDRGSHRVVSRAHAHPRTTFNRREDLENDAWANLLNIE